MTADTTDSKTAHTIVISNEKGGTGKSTLSMHLAVKLMQEGFRVACADMDGRQGTLSRYIENRRNFSRGKGIELPIPECVRFSPEGFSAEAFSSKMAELAGRFDAIIVDTPGAKNALFDEAHKHADTLITPVSDSLIDLNVLAEVDFAAKRISKPAHYANFVWEAKKYLAGIGKPSLNWVVVGNKLANFNSKNKQTVFGYLEEISKIQGFRLAEGLKDRVIYKELFLEGLTVLDMNESALKARMNLSHLAAKQEIRNLMEFVFPG